MEVLLPRHAGGATVAMCSPHRAESYPARLAI